MRLSKCSGMLWKTEFLEYSKTMAAAFDPHNLSIDRSLVSRGPKYPHLHLADQEISLHFKREHRWVWSCWDPQCWTAQETHDVCLYSLGVADGLLFPLPVLPAGLCDAGASGHPNGRRRNSAQQTCRDQILFTTTTSWSPRHTQGLWFLKVKFTHENVPFVMLCILYYYFIYTLLYYILNHGSIILWSPSANHYLMSS